MNFYMCGLQIKNFNLNFVPNSGIFSPVLYPYTIIILVSIDFELIYGRKDLKQVGDPFLKVVTR